MLFRRFVARLTLACYGVIALGGQGLHTWLEPAHLHAQHEAEAEHAAEASHSAAHDDGLSRLESQHQGHEHDCDHCVVCQFQALGQLCVVAAPLVSGPVECESLKPTATESVVCVALYWPAQPRAPPVV